MELEPKIESPLRAIRNTCNLTQAELAKIAGISTKGLISEIENGMRPLTKKIISALKKAQFDIDGIIERQEAFMKQREEQLQHRFKEISEHNK